GSDLFSYNAPQPEKTQGQNGQNKQHHQGKGGIQTVIRLQHEIAQPFVGGHKFRYNGARHGENDGNFDSGEHKGNRVREPDLFEDIELRSAVDARQFQKLRLHFFESHDGIDDDRKKRHQKGDRNLGSKTVADPDHHERRKGALPHSVVNHYVLVNRILKMSLVDDSYGERYTEN